MVNANTKPLKVIFVPLDCIDLLDLLLVYNILASFLSLQLLWYQKVPLLYHYIISILQKTLRYKLCPKINV